MTIDEQNLIVITTEVFVDEDPPSRSDTTSPTTTTTPDFDSTTIPSTTTTLSNLYDCRERSDFEDKVRKRRSVKSMSLSGALQELRRKSLTLLDITSWKVSVEQFQNSFGLYTFIFEQFISRKDARRAFQDYLKNVARNEGLYQQFVSSLALTFLKKNYSSSSKKSKAMKITRQTKRDTDKPKKF